MNYFISIIYCLILACLTSFADGNRVGNGGDVIVCSTDKNNPDIFKIQFLDFFEGQVDFNFELGESKETDPFNIAFTKIEELSKYDTKTASMYFKKLNQFKKTYKLLDKVALADIKDSSELALPIEKNCELKQIAIRNLNTSTESAHFIIHQNYWNNLPATSQAGLILHELIYDHLYILGEKNSIKVRQFNRFIFNKKFADLKKSDYWSFIQSLKVPIYQ